MQSQKESLLPKIRVVRPKFNLNTMCIIIVKMDSTHHEKSNEGSTKSVAPIFLELLQFETRDFRTFFDKIPTQNIPTMWHRNDVLFNGQFCIFTHNYRYNYATKMVDCSLELY